VGKRYSISNDPNARALVGVSTGAVGAFMAAWNRPDQFRRVLSFIGTFVAMKGTDTLPALIRKTEPKPLRILRQDGRNDHITPNQAFGTFYAGSWPINNQVMFQALEYAGYDVKFELGEGGHDMVQGAAILPDALRWLWRDYPAPIEVHPPAAYNGPGWDPRGKVLSVISYDRLWQMLEGPYRSVTSLTRDSSGNVFFLDSASGDLCRANAEPAPHPVLFGWR
jgi:gluconolactonase